VADVLAGGPELEAGFLNFETLKGCFRRKGGIQELLPKPNSDEGNQFQLPKANRFFPENVRIVLL